MAGGVEPDRALADHAFAHRLARRAGTLIMVGPGPLVVAPDLSAGLPSDPATRAGRALALQLIGVALARGDGLPAEQIVIDPCPPWLTDEPEPAAHAIAEVAVRRALFPGHPFGFVQPPSGGAGELWGYLRAAAAVHAGDVALVLGRLDPATARGTGRRWPPFGRASARWPGGRGVDHAGGAGRVGPRARPGRGRPPPPPHSTGSPTRAGGPSPATRSATAGAGCAVRRRSPSEPSPSTRSRRCSAGDR